MPTYHLTPDEPLRLDMEEAEAVRRTPPSYRVKGMFISPLVRMLGDEWAHAVKELGNPPRMGRYLPFNDYPQRDLLKLIYRLGRRDHPGVGAFEMFRRFAQRDFATFADSTLGRVVLTTIAEPVSALLKFPDVYAKVAPGPWKLSAEQLGPRRVAIQIENHPGVWGAQVGQFEAIVSSFNGRAEFEIQVEDTAEDLSTVRFEVRCT